MFGFLLFLFLVFVVCFWLDFFVVWGVVCFGLGEVCVFVVEGELGLDEDIRFIVDVFLCIIEVIWFFMSVVVFLLSIFFILVLMVDEGGVELCCVFVLVFFVFRL